MAVAASGMLSVHESCPVCTPDPDVVLVHTPKPEWHIKGDVLNVLNSGWDMMIAHPTCTYLTNSGVCWLWNKDGSRNEDRWQKLKEGAEFFKSLLDAPIPLMKELKNLFIKKALEYGLVLHLDLEYRLDSFHVHLTYQKLQQPQ